MTPAGTIPLILRAALAAWAALVCGCAGPVFRDRVVTPGPAPSPQALEQASRTLAGLYPAHYRAVQRAIIMAGGKQFACDGVLDASPETGWRLAVVSALGLVCETRIAPSGAVALPRITPLMREEWSRQFVAETVRLLFVPQTGASYEGRLADGRLVFSVRDDAGGPAVRYIFDASGSRLEEAQTLRRGKPLWQARFRDYRLASGHPTPVPFAFDADAAACRIELRTVDWKAGRP